MMRKLFFVGALALVTVLTGCGGSSGSNGGNGGGGGGGNSVSVSIAPTNATVALNGTQQFSATVTPSSAAQTVTWSV
ncbi:MAG TPA: Ig-like domain-containing protein, partial [Terriglobales bacterium]|nr:Ig-like domain-containing protein [Terriglobales bacterium]